MTSRCNVVEPIGEKEREERDGLPQRHRGTKAQRHTQRITQRTERIAVQRQTQCPAVKIPFSESGNFYSSSISALPLPLAIGNKKRKKRKKRKTTAAPLYRWCGDGGGGAHDDINDTTRRLVSRYVIHCQRSDKRRQSVGSRAVISLRPVLFIQLNFLFLLFGVGFINSS